MWAFLGCLETHSLAIIYVVRRRDHQFLIGMAWVIRITFLQFQRETSDHEFKEKN